MPLESALRQQIIEYCDKHLEDRALIPAFFDFIEDDALKNQIASEYVSARYIYKLGEALLVSDARQHSHNKFQIVQFASIYEAIIVYMLWKKFPDHAAVRRIESHNVYKKVAALPENIRLTSKPEFRLLICELSPERTGAQSIKFDDKVKAAVEIGFLDEQIGEEIKLFYRLRNGIHIESAVKNNIKFEMEAAMKSYQRVKPFTTGIKGFLKTGVLPKTGRLNQPSPLLLKSK